MTILELRNGYDNECAEVVGKVSEDAPVMGVLVDTEIKTVCDIAQGTEAEVFFYFSDQYDEIKDMR